jgi:hypothetical protein
LIFINVFFFSFKFLFCWILRFWRFYFGLIDELIWMLWVMSYLVDFGRLQIMILSYDLLKGWTWVRNLNILVGNMWKIRVWSWRWWNFSLVLELWKSTYWSLEHNSRIWIEFKMNYAQNFSIVMKLWHFQFGPLIWQNYNLTPKNMLKFQISSWNTIWDSGQKWGWIMRKIPV